MGARVLYRNIVLDSNRTCPWRSIYTFASRNRDASPTDNMGLISLQNETSGYRGSVSSSEDELNAQASVKGGSPVVTTSQSPTKPRFLVTGACGQIGLELVPFLRARMGKEAVIASDVNCCTRELSELGPFLHADVTDFRSLRHAVVDNGVDYVIHLASVLSARGETNPQQAITVNVQGIQNVLEVARQLGLRGVFAPSSIAVFGPSAPKNGTPDAAVLNPSTVYGITKVHLELLGSYYRRAHGVDFRSLRYPGIVSARSAPGGGTTDYAVDMLRHATDRHGAFRCFLEEHQALPMMYMPDCLKATVTLISAHPEQLTQCVYNVTAMSFSPRQLADAITRHIPSFVMHSDPDFRQRIAATWPRSVDDSAARRDWAWRPDFNLQAMTTDMLKELSREQTPGATGSNGASREQLLTAVL